MWEKKLWPAELARRSNLSKTTVSRICQNTNHKGTSYSPTHIIVMAVCVGLGLNKEEAREAFFAAFPELRLFETILEKRLDIIDANALLDENGVPTLGIVEE